MPANGISASSALKRMVAPLIDPVAFDFWAAKVNPLLSWERPLARVVARHVAARDSVTLVLKPNRHVPPVQAGQHVPVTVEVDGVRLTRSYSPSSVDNSGRLAITVKRIPGGRVSSHLCQHVRVGDVLELGEAFGEMTLRPEVPRWLYIAAGSGITPLMSLLRAQASGQRRADVTLLYWARTRADLCFLDELRHLDSHQPGVRVHIILTREATLLPGEHSGRPDADVLARLVPDLAERQVYACGTGGFVDSLRTLLADRVKGFDAEAFTLPERAAVAGAPVQVTLRRSGRVLDIPAGEALLPALEARGIHPKHGCRMGICNSCACDRISGTSENLNTGATQTEPGVVRICISAARSDMTLDL